jgi:dTDP-4-dehydrorhamnose reductase
MVEKSEQIMNILVLGAAGQLGQCLLPKLNASVENIFAPSSIDFKLPIDKENFENAVDFQPEIIINLAAYTNVKRAEIEREEAWNTNFLGVQTICALAKKTDARIIHISTDYVFSGNNKKPWKINDHKSPQTYYGFTKSKSEDFLLSEYVNRVWILRTAWLYSEYRQNFVKEILRKILLEEKEIEVVNDQYGQPTSAHDLSEVIGKIMKTNVNSGIMHATNSGETTWYNLANKISRLSLNTKSLITPIKSSALKEGTRRPKYSVLSHKNLLPSDVSPMRNWEIAFEEVFPRIQIEVMKEIENGI